MFIWKCLNVGLGSLVLILFGIKLKFVRLVLIKIFMVNLIWLVEYFIVFWILKYMVCWYIILIYNMCKCNGRVENMLVLWKI